MWFTIVSLVGRTCHNLKNCNNQSQDLGHNIVEPHIINFLNSVIDWSEHKIKRYISEKNCNNWGMSIHTTSFSSSSLPPPMVTSANSGLKPSTWLASFSINEYGINCRTVWIKITKQMVDIVLLFSVMYYMKKIFVLLSTSQHKRTTQSDMI